MGLSATAENRSLRLLLHLHAHLSGQFAPGVPQQRPQPAFADGSIRADQKVCKQRLGNDEARHGHFERHKP